MTDKKITGDDQNVELSFEVYKTYDGSQIQVLEGLEAVRRRPGMYIGTTDTRGLHHLVIELIDNGVDEGMAGFATNIFVRIMKNGGVRVTDNGRGIPVDWNNEHQMSSLELIMTKLHSGGKFSDSAYKFSGGLHGVGLSVVNALSLRTIVEIFRPDVCYRQVYEKGIPMSGVEETAFSGLEAPEGINHGTAIYFEPDPEIFDSIEFLFETLDARVKEMAYLTACLRLSLIDEREEQVKEVSYRYKDGIKQFVIDRNTYKEALIENSEFVFYTEGEEDGVIIEIALTYNNGYNRILSGFVNGINTREGGTHISGFKSALTRSVNDFGRSTNLFKGKESNLSGEDIREGLVSVVSVKHADPQFEGQTKTRLGNSEVDGITQRIFFSSFQEYLLENPNFGKAIMLKSIQARRAREAAQKTRNLVRSKGARVSLPGRLVPSREKDPAKRELFLVEGQSAGGTAVKARDSQYQEILFLKGKVLNVEKARIDKILDNQEIKHIIMALGTGIGDEFDITHCRYGKVILLSDADVDGAHITTLLLTLFYRLMRPLFDYGIIYVKKQVKLLGPKNETYLATEEERNELVAKLVESGQRENRIQVQRYKGLGEMNADQLEITAMDPETRAIFKIMVRNEDEAEELFSVLMGDDVKARREFIIKEVFKKELSLDEAITDAIDPIIEITEVVEEEYVDPTALYLEEGDELDESEVYKESSEIFEGDEELVDLIETEDEVKDEDNESKKKKRFGIF
jgi:DNA gyrase subunit B